MELVALLGLVGTTVSTFNGMRQAKAMKEQQAQLEEQRRGREAVVNGGRGGLAYTEDTGMNDTLGGDPGGDVSGQLRRRLAQ